MYLDTDVIARANYYYIVRASNFRGEGSASSDVNTTLANGSRPPDAPIALTAKAEAAFVSLSWKDLVNQTESIVVAYNIYRTNVPGANPTVSIAILHTRQQYFIDTNLISGTYYYKVSAINFAEGPRSNESSAIVSGIEPGSPGTIASMSLLEEGNDIRLSWQAPPQGASPILRYLVYRSLTPYDPVFLNYSSTTAYVDGDVIAGQTMHYWVVAENGQGQGPLSAMMAGSLHSRDLGIGGETLLVLALAALAVAAIAVIIWMRNRR
jgi:hypothetical protein